MIKKITLGFLLFFIITSCGKKGDPVYKESKKILLYKTILINKV
jgi:hypothetical protein